jgi:hypothetical protein
MFQNALLLLGQADVQKIIGSTVAPPNPALANPFAGISRLFIVGIQLFLSLAAITVLIYLLWGAYDWITSGGDSENVAKAQSKMTNAVIGIILIIVALTVFNVVAGNILGIVTKDGNGNWIFKLPSINDNSPQQKGVACTDNSQCISGLCIKSAANPTGFCQ